MRERLNPNNSQPPPTPRLRPLVPGPNAMDELRLPSSDILPGNRDICNYALPQLQLTSDNFSLHDFNEQVATNAEQNNLKSIYENRY